MKGLFLIVVFAVVACSSDAPLKRSATQPPVASPWPSETVVSSRAPTPSNDAGIVGTLEAACAAIAMREGPAWAALVTSTNRILVLQSYDRPVHVYADGTRLVVCMADPRGLRNPWFLTYQVAEIVATRSEQARLNNDPPIGLVTPLVCIQVDQGGAYRTCWGVVDPIVASARFVVPGMGSIEAELGAGPRIEIGNASTDVYFVVQWPGSERSTDWLALDSCGIQLGRIAMSGPQPTPTPCPPVR